MLKVKVTTRFGAYDYCRNGVEVPTAMISISTPKRVYDYTPFVNDSNNIVDILPIKFVDKDVGKDIITQSQGKQIAEFVNKYISEPYNLNHFIVHCDAGTSRSAGVAAAILKWANNDDSQIFGRNRYIPNMLVYRTVLESLMD